MAKFSKHFALGKTQSELDFVDTDPQKDTPLYVDPFAIEMRSDAFALASNRILRQFFQELIDAIRNGDTTRIGHLMSNLREPSDTFLGVSKGKPQGRGVGDIQSAQIVKALAGSAAAKSGRLADLSESTLYIDNIGRDKISDLTTNLIRGVLAEYTQAQCKLHNITALRKVPASAPLWHQARACWVADYVDLPMVGRKPVLLVPKYFVRRKISLEGHDLYERLVVEFLQAEHRRPGDALAQVLKNGKIVVTKKAIREKYPFSKDFLYEMISKHPKLLAEYKTIQAAVAPPTSGDITEGFQEATHAVNLSKLLRSVPVGDKSASVFHSLMVGILTFLFHPSLISPTKEAEINQGRKRIDILYTNSTSGDFFQRIANQSSTHSNMVPVECKNYGSEIGNPEVDQLLTRFSHTVGRFGLLICRKLANRAKAIARCRDAAKAGQGYVVILEDTDVFELLHMVENLRRNQIQQRLNMRFDELLT